MSSEYERERERRLLENQQKLFQLGLVSSDNKMNLRGDDLHRRQRAANKSKKNTDDDNNDDEAFIDEVCLIH